MIKLIKLISEYNKMVAESKANGYGDGSGNGRGDGHGHGSGNERWLDEC